MFERLRRQVGQLGLAKAIVGLRGIVLLAGKDDTCAMIGGVRWTGGQRS